MISRRAFLAGVVCTAWGQDPSFSTDVKVVSLLATVQDKDGGVVKDLNKDDFVLLEDGKPQIIRYFTRESNLPLTLGLLVDTSRSQTGVLERERDASYAFFSQVLRDNIDQAFVVAFDTEVRVLQGLTSSREELSSALARLKTPGEVATLLYEAIRRSSVDPMKHCKGRQAFILLTDGVAFRDKTSIGTAIEYAQMADAIIYSIRFSSGEGFPGTGRELIRGIAAEKGKQALARMAAETGGAALEVSKGNPIEKLFAEIEDSLRSQYSIGYTPARPDDSGKFHKIKLTVRNRGLIVRTRDGYYSR